MHYWILNNMYFLLQIHFHHLPHSFSSTYCNIGSTTQHREFRTELRSWFSASWHHYISRHRGLQTGDMLKKKTWWNGLFNDDGASIHRAQELNEWFGILAQVSDSISTTTTVKTPHEGISSGRMVFIHPMEFRDLDSQCQGALKLFWWHMVAHHH